MISKVCVICIRGTHIRTPGELLINEHWLLVFTLPLAIHQRLQPLLYIMKNHVNHSNYFRRGKWSEMISCTIFSILNSSKIKKTQKFVAIFCKYKRLEGEQFKKFCRMVNFIPLNIFCNVSKLPKAYV